MDPNKAAKMFVTWKKWRASFVPLGFIPDSEVMDQLDAKKIYLQGLSIKVMDQLDAKKIYLQGLSKDGHPVMIVKASKHYPAKDQPQFKKFVVHLLDKVIASGFKGKEIGNEKLIGVLDLDQIGYKNVDARGLITGFQFLQIIIVSNEEEKSQFVKDVGEDVLPLEYGGHAKLVAVQDVVLPPLED
ncbi:sec14 cytosolic factor-like protein [Tanacetum coccineum]